jgi:hypothetical protein
VAGSTTGRAPVGSGPASAARKSDLAPKSRYLPRSYAWKWNGSACAWPAAVAANVVPLRVTYFPLATDLAT